MPTVIKVLYQGLGLNWISLYRTLPQAPLCILSQLADFHTLWPHPVCSHTLTPNGNLARWETIFCLLFFLLFFSSFLLRQSFSVCKSNWRQGWTRTQRDAPACSLPHRPRINSMQQTTDSSFGIYSPLALHPEKKLSLLYSHHRKKWVFSHAAAQRTCTFLLTAVTSLFIQSFPF